MDIEDKHITLNGHDTDRAEGLAMLRSLSFILEHPNIRRLIGRDALPPAAEVELSHQWGGGDIDLNYDGIGPLQWTNYTCDDELDSRVEFSFPEGEDWGPEVTVISNVVSFDTARRVAQNIVTLLAHPAVRKAMKK